METELPSEEQLPIELQNILVKTNLPTIDDIRLLQQHKGSYSFEGEDKKLYLVDIWDNAIFVHRLGDTGKEVISRLGVAFVPSVYSYQIIDGGVLCETYASPTEYHLALKKIVGI